MPLPSAARGASAAGGNTVGERDVRVGRAYAQLGAEIAKVTVDGAQGLADEGRRRRPKQRRGGFR